MMRLRMPREGGLTMSEAQVRSGSNAAPAGALALAVLCSQQFIVAYDTLIEGRGLDAACR